MAIEKELRSGQRECLEEISQLYWLINFHKNHCFRQILKYLRVTVLFCFVPICTHIKVNKPKKVNAPEGLNQVILRKVQRFITKKVAKTFASTYYKLPFINANNFQ